MAEAETANLGLSGAAAKPPDGVVLDLGLPDLDGLAVLRRLREWSKVPVLVLTVRDSEDDKIAALDAGADDYLTKPFSSRELLARLRGGAPPGAPAPESSVVSFGASKWTWWPGSSAGAWRWKLTGKEYALLCCSPSTGAGSSPTARSCARSGGPTPRTAPTTCACR